VAPSVLSKSSSVLYDLHVIFENRMLLSTADTNLLKSDEYYGLYTPDNLVVVSC
jgi:hypothetical protein